MNALWLTRFFTYKNSPKHIESAKRLIEVKIVRENALLKRYKRAITAFGMNNAHTIQEILLIEARAAKHFWGEFRTLIPSWSGFFEREPHKADVTNQLLDIGYHHLTNIVRKLLEQHTVPADIALLHVARNADSAPLAYDLVEMFRSDIVDAEVLRFLRLKKKKLETINQKTIAHFVHELNLRLEHRHYLKAFRACASYRYYMELQILRFIKAVNHDEIFEPLYLPTRHDTRCLTASPPMVSLSSDKVFEIR